MHLKYASVKQRNTLKIIQFEKLFLCVRQDTFLLLA